MLLFPMVLHHSNGNFLTRRDLKVRQQKAQYLGQGEGVGLNSCSAKESDNRGLAEDRACSVWTITEVDSQTQFCHMYRCCAPKAALIKQQSSKDLLSVCLPGARPLHGLHSHQTVLFTTGICHVVGASSTSSITHLYIYHWFPLALPRAVLWGSGSI